MERSLLQRQHSVPAGDEPVAKGPPGAPAVERPSLVAEDLVKSWGNQVVLQAVGLSLPSGTSAWVSGRNGAGKTTLMRIVAGLITADRGTLTLNGVGPDHRRDYQRQIGFLPAGDSGLYARLSVRQNLEFWASIAFVRPSERRELVHRALRRFSMEDLASRRADRLSLGQRQRVRLAMTFLHEPELVLLDEPTTSLDDDGVGLLASALAEHVEGGGMALLCAPREDDRLRFDCAYLLDQARLEPA